MSRSSVAIILAAGKSTRMKSEWPKVLHEVCGRPMLAYVIDACREAGIGRVLVVVGHRANDVRSAFASEPGLEWVEQPEQRGTGHAVMCCLPKLDRFEGNAIVLAGDGPLIRSDVLGDIVRQHDTSGVAVTIATSVLDEPTGYGRIVRDDGGNLVGIVEERDCSPEQKAIREVNPSYYCFTMSALRDALGEIKPNNAQGEFYLTDAVSILVQSGRGARAIANVKPEDVLSINDRRQLAAVTRVLQDRIQSRLMAEGVTIVDPATTWIDSRAKLGADTVVQPFSYIAGPATLGRGCRVGPFAKIAAGTVLEDGSQWPA